ncbi:YfiR/HmsC family protein [Algibacter sp. L4_22]|uniref:YfiR/HmsC family protein n=1 Tax=Algibacter sp. L4_22 TaxID=2942477 RepID=UPI00201B67B8|nr:YfiR/HmsC family protein [Algibacter sp. L4_22]MCL5127101.1 YfiR/HmsC family protein [Algibacter sp. L4_22]
MKSNFLIKCVFIVFYITSVQVYSQNTSIEQVKRVKRAIFIFNIAEQTSYGDTNISSEFIIGVLGKDRTIIDLKSLAEKRQIKNKPVKVVGFSSVKDIENVDIIYTNYNKNFDVDYILNKISGNNTLLITENYPYNSSMINIVNVGNDFQYEINENLMQRNNISALFNLRKNAISSIEKWKQFFQNSENTLAKTKDQLSKAEDSVKLKDEEIQSQKQIISINENKLKAKDQSLVNQKTEIKELISISEFQKKKYSDKLIIEKELEHRILKQIDSLNKQKEQIVLSNSEIEIQQTTLAKQKEDILNEEVKARAISEKLNTQRTVNYLLLILILFALIFGWVLFKNYYSTKRLNNVLKQKNDTIYNQSFTLASKNKELEEFAYITSHDLKEPLATISGLIDLLKDDYKDKLDEDAMTSMDFIDKSSERMRTQIDDLLEYSKLGKSKDKTNVDCNDLLNEITSDIANAITRFNAKIIYQDLPTVSGSKVELRGVFQNLINNAIKFKKVGVSPQVTINYTTFILEEQNKAFWQFEVTDNGIGIAEKHKHKIFSIFQRLHSREEYEGTGIGLSFCKKIVESLGGEIWFESELNKGTTFFFTIPK